MPKPTVGRGVHYTPTVEAARLQQKMNLPQQPMAAIVSALDRHGTVTLHVFVPDRDLPWVATRVPFSEEPKPGHWSWPPKEG